MTTIYINSMSVVAPGMMGLAQALPILRGEQAWQNTPLDKIVPELLPANERRRTTALIKLCLKAGQEAMTIFGDEHTASTVFASSEGELEITDKICQALLLDDKPVSPTQFHNSVHNAAAGYWAIAAQSKTASVSLSAGDASFAAGLLEAISQIMQDDAPVLYIACDYPGPPMLNAKRHLEFPFACAILLSKQKLAGSLASIDVKLCNANQPVSTCKSTTLEQMRNGNPMACSLPLLEAIVADADVAINVPYLNQQTIEIRVCH